MTSLSRVQLDTNKIFLISFSLQPKVVDLSPPETPKLALNPLNRSVWEKSQQLARQDMLSPTRCGNSFASLRAAAFLGPPLTCTAHLSSPSPLPTAFFLPPRCTQAHPTFSLTHTQAHARTHTHIQLADKAMSVIASDG